MELNYLIQGNCTQKWGKTRYSINIKRFYFILSVNEAHINGVGSFYFLLLMLALSEIYIFYITNIKFIM